MLGDSAWTEEEIEASNLVALKNERVRSVIQEMSIGVGENAGRLVCSGVINNLAVSESFYAREIGVMANDPDVGEILYLIDPIAANAPTTVIEGNAARQDVPIRMELIAVSRDQVELVLSDSVDLVATSRLSTAMDEIRAYVDAKVAEIIAVKLQGHPASDFANWDYKHDKTDINDFPVSMPASDVSAWAKAAAKPVYTAAEVGALAAGGIASDNERLIGCVVSVDHISNTSTVMLRSLSGATVLTGLYQSGAQKYLDPSNYIGNAATADRLKPARTINGVPFDGTENITIAASPSTHTGFVLTPDNTTWRKLKVLDDRTICSYCEGRGFTDSNGDAGGPYSCYSCGGSGYFLDAGDRGTKISTTKSTAISPNFVLKYLN